ncbi:hypothetical protein FHG87_018489 [Trinorchestia longiramus]|nr:hypothetical protein FHG87_018489 [Trinorchestia longiramus]
MRGARGVGESSPSSNPDHEEVVFEPNISDSGFPFNIYSRNSAHAGAPYSVEREREREREREKERETERERERKRSNIERENWSVNWDSQSDVAETQQDWNSNFFDIFNVGSISETYFTCFKVLHSHDTADEAEREMHDGLTTPRNHRHNKTKKFNTMCRTDINVLTVG